MEIVQYNTLYKLHQSRCDVYITFSVVDKLCHVILYFIIIYWGNLWSQLSGYTQYTHCIPICCFI